MNEYFNKTLPSKTSKHCQDKADLNFVIDNFDKAKQFFDILSLPVIQTTAWYYEN